jgi:hypothetical protein
MLHRQAVGPFSGEEAHRSHVVVGFLTLAKSEHGGDIAVPPSYSQCRRTISGKILRRRITRGNQGHGPGRMLVHPG